MSPGATNRQRDEATKRKLYARRGVDEYWIVDWEQQVVSIYRRADEDLAAVTTLTAYDTLTSPLLPGWTLPLADLFAGLAARTVDDSSV